MNIGNALILHAMLLGSVIIGFNPLPFNIILNCLLGCSFALIAMKYFLEGGGLLRSTSFDVKKRLWLGYFKVECHNNYKKVKFGERKRILKSCWELRIQVVSNQYVTNSSYVEFLNAVLIQTVNYSLALK